MRVNIYQDKLKFVGLNSEQLTKVNGLLDGLSSEMIDDVLFVKGSKDKLFSLLFKLCRDYDVDLI